MSTVTDFSFANMSHDPSTNALSFLPAEELNTCRLVSRSADETICKSVVLFPVWKKEVQRHFSASDEQVSKFKGTPYECLLALFRTLRLSIRPIRNPTHTSDAFDPAKYIEEITQNPKKRKDCWALARQNIPRTVEKGNLLESILSDRLIATPEPWLKLIELKADASSFFFLPESIKDDPEFMLKLMKLYPLSFHCASDRLKDTPEFMLQAIKIKASFRNSLSKRLNDDPEFMQKVNALIPGQGG